VGEICHTIMVPMTDGVRLATDVHLPEGRGPWPVLLARTPYGKGGVDPSRLLERGYAVVVQDLRGTGDSEGENMFFLADGWGVLRDGYDTLVWIRQQGWRNGRIGTFGGSALGITQALLAPTLPPGLGCQHIYAAPFDLYTTLYPGGVLRNAMLESWMSRRGSERAAQIVLSHRQRDRLWSLLDASSQFERIRCPIMHVGGWFDPFCSETIDAFNALQSGGGPGARGNQSLVIGPWIHGGTRSRRQGELVFPENAVYDLEEEMLEWFDEWLKGQRFQKKPIVRYYVMGEASGREDAGNYWRGSERFPPPSQPYKLYFTPDGRLLPSPPDLHHKALDFTYEPSDPVPSIGGATLRALDPGPRDQRAIETREDVLVYDTPGFEAEVEVTGRVSVELCVSSTATTTDFTAKLTDVYPDGRSILMLEGIRRIRGLSNKPVRIKIDLGYISLIFSKGHRIRIDISSSNYPMYEKNPNTEDAGRTGGGVVARNTIHHGSGTPSSITLPVIRSLKESEAA